MFSKINCKKALSTVLSVVMLFTAVAVSPIATSLTSSATGDVEVTTPAVWIGPSTHSEKVPSAVFYSLTHPKDYNDGTTAVLSATVKKLAGKSGSKPYVTMYRSKKAGGNSNQTGMYTYPGWADNAGSTYDETTGAFSCTVTFSNIPGNSNSWYYQYFNEGSDYYNVTHRIFATWSGVYGIWGGISIGNCAYDDEGYSSSYNDFTAEYIITNVSLVITGRSESLVNNVDSYDDASVYSLTGHKAKGSNSSAHNIPFEGSRTNWKSFTTDSTTVKFGKVASDFMSVGASGYTAHTETDYNVAYYTRSDCSGVNFKKYGSGCFMKMGSPDKKSFIIKAGGDSSTYTNLYIPINSHDWFSGFDRTDAGCSDNAASGNLRESDGNFRLRVSFKCRVVSGSGIPVVGRMYSYPANEDADGSNRHDNYVGWPTPYSNSAYNPTNNDRSSYNTNVISVLPNITNGVYTADISMASGYYQQMSRSGVTDFITIGLAEHRSDEPTDFDALNTDTTFIISDIKFEVYGIYGKSLSNEVLFGGANQAPEMIEDNYDIVTPHLYTARGNATVDNKDISLNTRNSKLNHYYAEGNMEKIADIKANICNINGCTLTHHDETETTREYYECTVHNKKYDDEFASNELESIAIVRRMLRLGGYSEGQQAIVQQKQLDIGETYRFDVDYRACGGVLPLINTQIANTSTGSEDTEYYGLTKVDTGTHVSLTFTMPSNAKVGVNNFKIYLGQKWPLRRNGNVFFANVSLYKIVNGRKTGSNLLVNGDFSRGSVGKVTSSNKDTVFYGWEQVKVMTYSSVEILNIPLNFFVDDKSLNLDNVYEFKGGDVYKPQFDFHFTANTSYKLIYDYYCDEDDTVNAYIISKDNSVTATKESKLGNGKYEAEYSITANSACKSYNDLQSANGSIRFALNNNSYDKPFSISNIRIYKYEGGETVGANLVYSLNAVFSDSMYSLNSVGDKCNFTLAKNDSSCDSQKTDIATGWVGNLDYNNASKEATYSRIVKTNGHIFDYYYPSDRLTAMVNALLGKTGSYNPYTDTDSRYYDPLKDGKTNILDLITLKKNIVNNIYDYNVTNEQTNGGIYPSFAKVSCYGDSITQGMGYESSPLKTYPGKLASLIGSGYTVYNCGDPGERSYTIMSRQGALSLVTSKEITFPAGTAQVQIGTNSDNGFITLKGDYIDLTSRLGGDKSINKVTIGNAQYEVIMTDFTWSPRACNIHLKRTNTSGSLTIPKGTKVTFNSYTNQDECDIYLCGANGVYTSANDLVAQYKAMIDRHGSNNYIVIVPFWNTYCTAYFKEAFGDHCVDFRLSAISDGLAFEGITPTSTDNEYIARGEVPPSLLYYPDNPDVHLNAKGYDLLAHLIYEQGKTLGYFN